MRHGFYRRIKNFFCSVLEDAERQIRDLFQTRRNQRQGGKAWRMRAAKVAGITDSARNSERSDLSHAMTLIPIVRVQ